MKKTILSVTAAVFLLACSQEQSQDFNLEGKEFKLAKLIIDGKELELNGENKPFITFAKGQFSGFAGCNRFFGNFTQEKNKLNIAENSGATKMLCDPESMSFEDNLLGNFNSTFEIKSENNALTLEKANFKIILQN